MRKVLFVSVQHLTVQLTCGAQAVVQQLRRQEARGAGRVGGGARCRSAALCSCARRGDAGRVEHPKRILPLPAEVIAAPWTRAEEVLEEVHIAALAILVQSQTCL